MEITLLSIWVAASSMLQLFHFSQLVKKKNLKVFTSTICKFEEKNKARKKQSSVLLTYLVEIISHAGDLNNNKTSKKQAFRDR